MFRRSLLGGLSVLALASIVLGTDFYVSPAGTPTADGSIANPWNLQHALTQPAGWSMVGAAVREMFAVVRAAFTPAPK